MFSRWWQQGCHVGAVSFDFWSLQIKFSLSSRFVTSPWTCFDFRKFTSFSLSLLPLFRYVVNFISNWTCLAALNLILLLVFDLLWACGSHFLYNMIDTQLQHRQINAMRIIQMKNVHSISVYETLSRDNIKRFMCAHATFWVLLEDCETFGKAVCWVPES